MYCNVSEKSYWYFNGALSKEICNKIISLGEHKIALNKLNGTTSPAATAGYNEKAEYSENTPVNELSLSDLRKIGKTKDDFYSQRQ